MNAGYSNPSQSHSEHLNGSQAKSTVSVQKPKLRKDIFSLDFKEKEKEKSKVCFLSGRERKILSGGYSRLDCDYNWEKKDVGPGSYKTELKTSSLHQTLNKVTSKVGYGGLASKTPRFTESRRESINTFVSTPYHKKCLLHVPKLRVGKSVGGAPFGSTVPRQAGGALKQEETPGHIDQEKLLEEEIKNSTLWNSGRNDNV